jgi:thiol-disulfide isomerase/thioredoxin
MSESLRKALLIIVVIAVIGTLVYLEKGNAGPKAGVVDAVEAVPTDVMEPESTTTMEKGEMMKSAVKPVVKAPMIAPAQKIKKDAQYEKAKEIANPSGFLNTDEKPITIGSLIGKKVILVDFWTYSCINCQRTLPYLNAWYDKYKDKGLEIVSIHTPEFDFEKDKANVAKAAEKYGVKYPIVQDNDYGTWSAYGNRYWPRKYLIDVDGYIVYDHIGEGGYDESEKRIQEALKEREERLGMANSIDTSIVKPGNVVEISNVGSPETYLGSSRNGNFGNGTPGVAYESNFTLPKILDRNTYYLEGKWKLTDEFAETQGPGKIVYRYKAKNVYLVVSAPQGVRATILIDGKPVGADGGKDVVNGKVDFKADALYHLVSHGGDAEEHVIEIIFDSEGARAFAFTFG